MKKKTLAKTRRAGKRKLSKKSPKAISPKTRATVAAFLLEDANSHDRNAYFFYDLVDTYDTKKNIQACLQDADNHWHAYEQYKKLAELVAAGKVL